MLDRVEVLLGAGGVERIVGISLNPDEQAMFDKSVDAVKGLVAACKAIDPSFRPDTDVFSPRFIEFYQRGAAPASR